MWPDPPSSQAPGQTPRGRKRYGLAAVAAVFLGCSGYQDAWIPSYTTQLSLLNATHEAHELTIHLLPEGTTLRCEAPWSAAQATQKLWRAIFEPEPALRVTLYSGQELPLEPYHLRYSGYTEEYPWFEPVVSERGCSAVLVRSPALGDTIIAWPRRMGHKSMYVDVSIPASIPPDPQTVVIEADYSQVRPGVERQRWREITCGRAWREPTCDASERRAALVHPTGARYAMRTHDVTPMHSSVSLPEAAASCQPAPPSQLQLSQLPPRGATRLLQRQEMEPWPGFYPCAAFVALIDDQAQSIPLCAPQPLMDLLTPSPDRHVVLERTLGSGALGAELDVQITHQTERGELLASWRVYLRRHAPTLEQPDQEDEGLWLRPRASAAASTRCVTRACGAPQPLVEATVEVLVQGQGFGPALLGGDQALTLPDGRTIHLLEATTRLRDSIECGRDPSLEQSGLVRVLVVQRIS